MLRIRDVYTESRIRIFSSQIQDQKDPDTASAFASESKNLSILKPKNCFWALGKNVLRCSSRIPIPESGFVSISNPGYGSSIQGSKKYRIPDPQHGTQILHRTGCRRNTNKKSLRFIIKAIWISVELVSFLVGELHLLGKADGKIVRVRQRLLPAPHPLLCDASNLKQIKESKNKFENW